MPLLTHLCPAPLHEPHILVVSYGRQRRAAQRFPRRHLWPCTAAQLRRDLRAAGVQAGRPSEWPGRVVKWGNGGKKRRRGGCTGAGTGRGMRAAQPHGGAQPARPPPTPSHPTPTPHPPTRLHDGSKRQLSTKQTKRSKRTFHVVSLPQGSFSVSSSHRMIPKEYTSLAEVAGSPLTISGAWWVDKGGVDRWGADRWGVGAVGGCAFVGGGGGWIGGGRVGGRWRVDARWVVGGA
jgi:hypothetical protein